MDANPSPDDVWKKLKAAIKLVKDDWKNHNRLKENELNRENNELKSAESCFRKMRERNSRKMLGCNGRKEQNQRFNLELNKLEAKIPGDERNRDVKQAEWKAMEAQFQPLFNCIVTGELHREIGEDVRIPVYRLVAVADDPAVDAQQE
ncbi:MAG: hypothetical protein R3B91_11955 [Planctomycetaceae bacterium]